MEMECGHRQTHSGIVCAASMGEVHGTHCAMVEWTGPGVCFQKDICGKVMTHTTFLCIPLACFDFVNNIDNFQHFCQQQLCTFCQILQHGGVTMDEHQEPRSDGLLTETSTGNLTTSAGQKMPTMTALLVLTMVVTIAAILATLI